MLHKDRAIHLGLRYGFITPAEVEGVTKTLKDKEDYEELKRCLIESEAVSEDRMIMLESVVTEEKNLDQGDILGDKYEIIRPLGSGAMAKVILAKNVENGQLVALKLVPVDKRDNKSLRYRFQQEIRLHSALRHPHIVRLYDSFLHDGRQVIAVEYIEGESLSRRLERKGPLPIREALEITRQVGEALAYLHHRDLIHRDIKPGNILISHKGMVKLLDLGLAKNLKEQDNYTEPGTAIGTPQYMAPEQAMGEGYVDQRADIYSLGVTLFHIITGYTPFDGNKWEVIKSHIKNPIPDSGLFRRGIPRKVRQLIKKATAHKAENRHQSAEELVSEIDEVLEIHLGLRENLLLLPYNRKVLAVLLVIVGAVLGVILFQYLDSHQLLERLGISE